MKVGVEKDMKKEKRDPRRHELILEMIENYHPQSIKDIQDMLKDMFADTMEDMLKAELDSELGYRKSDQQPKSTTNRRNSSYPKTVQSSLGESELQIPRDRNGDYEPELIPKGTKDISALEEKVLSLYAKGTSDRDISDVIDEIYGFGLSHETISNIVARIQPRVIEWQNRRLDKVYPFVYMDALMVSLKTDKKAGKYAVYNTFPEATVCRCMVHLVRNSTKYISTKHRKEFCDDLKAIYGAVGEGEAENALAVLNEKWGKQYPSAVKVRNDNFRYVQHLFEYPAEIRRMIYTTNTIESFNSALRKVTNRKATFPNELSVLKILYLRTLDIAAKWRTQYPNWGVIRGKLDILWGSGWDR